jgi:hypothetical protein
VGNCPRVDIWYRVVPDFDTGPVPKSGDPGKGVKAKMAKPSDHNGDGGKEQVSGIAISVSKAEEYEGVMSRLNRDGRQQGGEAGCESLFSCLWSAE